MISERDKQHLELAASFFSQLAVAFVAGAFLQLLIPDFGAASRIAYMLLTGLFLYGVAHAILDLAYRTAR